VIATARYPKTYDVTISKQCSLTFEVQSLEGFEIFGFFPSDAKNVDPKIYFGLNMMFITFTPSQADMRVAFGSLLCSGIGQRQWWGHSQHGPYP
jgi:hypothetical protein